MKKYLKYSILKIVSGAIFFVMFLVLAIMSIPNYNDGYGTDLGLNSDYVTVAIMAVIFLMVGIYNVLSINRRVNLAGVNVLSSLAIAIISCAYSYGRFFRLVFKQKTFDEQFPYFVWGLLSLGFVIYFIFRYIDLKKETEE